MAARLTATSLLVIDPRIQRDDLSPDDLYYGTAETLPNVRRGDAVYTFSDNFVAKTSLSNGQSIGMASLAVNATYRDYDDDYGYWYYVW